MTDRTSPTPGLSALAATERPLVRLDRLVNPYGPSPLVAESLAAIDDPNLDPERLGVRLARRLAAFSGVPESWVRPCNGIDEALRIALGHTESRPLLVMPPEEVPGPVVDVGRSGRTEIDVWRGAAYLPDLDPETAAELPSQAVAVVSSPHNPSGALLPIQDAVRLARACAFVFVDERCGGFGPRSLVNLAREFDNVVVFQTLETWAGLSAFPIGWAVAAPRTLDRLFSDHGGRVAAGAAIAGIATLDDLANVLTNVRRVRDERSRLFRMLRKLNMVQPFPSWAGFVLARSTRSSGDVLATELRRRGVVVHRPAGAGLADVLRISAGRPADTDALRAGLVSAGLVI